MDFSNRSAQPQQGQVPAPAAAHPAPGGSGKGRHSGDDNKWKRIGVVAAIAAVVIIIVMVIVLLVASSSNSNSESKYVDTGKLQAVFLNTGQVYFGNVKVLNSKYVVLTNIYYLQTSSSSTASTSTAANNVSLVKLGCELHEPYDQMVINRSQVTFWENLQDGGQVAKAVKTFEQQNPNGQKCADQSSSAPTTSGSNAQNAGSSSTPSTPAKP